MKIFACSNWKLKFLGLLVDYWRAQGHEVEYRMGYDPELHEWSELCFVDACDHNAHMASRNSFPNSRLAVRVIDIEAWVGQPGGVKWENVDVCIFGAEHIKEVVESYVSFPRRTKVVHVPFGVDLDAWTFKGRSHGHKVAHIAHQWTAKGLQLLFQVMAKLPGYELHTLGTRSRTDLWQFAYYEHIANELGLNWYHTDKVDNVDEWLEDKNYLILTSMKEAFSYVVAEAAAKGIKPLVHNFYGAPDIWPREWIWNTIDECLEKMRGAYDSESYRAYVKEHYSLERMMEGINKACRIK